MVSKRHMHFRLDHGIAWRGRVGLIVVAIDQTIEHEFRQVFAHVQGVGLYVSRIPFNSPDVCPDALTKTENDIFPAADVLLLPEVSLDVMAFGCTSATVLIGEDEVFGHIREARPGVLCTTPITAAIEGLTKLGSSRIALLTPYEDEINQKLCKFVEDRGIDVAVMGSFNHKNDDEVARISQDSIKDAVRELVAGSSSVDGVFVSCTSLRVANIVEELEAELGVPVTSSNHALAWHCLRLTKYHEPMPGFGRLFRM